MQDSHALSPYLTSEEAAAFIRKGHSTFRAYVRRYKIPRHGPAGDRYLEEDIRAFMRDKACFLGLRPPKPRERAFTPVRI